MLNHMLNHMFVLQFHAFMFVLQFHAFMPILLENQKLFDG